MDWWAWVLVVLAVVILAAGVPWLVYVVVRWLMARPGPFLAAEGQRRQALVGALTRQRAVWPSIPRLGRYREFDQKALDRLADLATTSSDVEQLWPGLTSYTGASFGPVEVATLRGWRAMVTALAARRDQRQVQQLLRVGEQQLEEIALLQGMVAEIPSAVTDLVRERAKQAEALVASVAAEAGLGTVGLEALRDEVRAAKLQTERVGELLAATDSPSDEALLGADRELERISAANASIASRLEAISTQRQAAGAALETCDDLVAALQDQWERLHGQGAREPQLKDRLTGAAQVIEQLHETLAARSPEAYAQAATAGQRTIEQLGEIQRQFDELGAALKAAQDGVAGDLTAIEDARQAVSALGERELPVLADASLAFIEEAAGAFRVAEEQLQAGSLTALRESSEAAMRGQTLLRQAQQRASETAQLADQAGALMTKVAPERRQGLRDRLEALASELGAYAVIWKTRLAATSGAAGQELAQADRLIEQLPQTLVAREQTSETQLGPALEILGRASGLVSAAEARVVQLEATRGTVLRQRAELEAAVTALRQGPLAEAQAVYPYMLAAEREALDAWGVRLDQESLTMLDPGQVDYDVALGSWLPAIREELDGVLQRHSQEVRRLSRALRDARGRLDRAWRRLQSLLDRDPRRPEEDVDQLFESFGAWWDGGDAADDQAAAMHELVDVQAPELEERIQRALDQLEDGRKVNRNLARDLAKARRDLDKAREQVGRRGADSGWPRLEWDLREPDDLWRRMNEAESASAIAPTMAQANALLEQAMALNAQAVEAYQREEEVALEALSKLDTSYQAAAKGYDAAVRQAAELRAAGPSGELTALETRLDAARRDLDAARAAVSIPEAVQRLRLAQDTLSQRTG